MNKVSTFRGRVFKNSFLVLQILHFFRVFQMVSGNGFTPCSVTYGPDITRSGEVSRRGFRATPVDKPGYDRVGQR